MARLNVWMDGEWVGEWSSLRTGTVFSYAETWLASPHARALSLSLPITADNDFRGPAVENYFDNLLPDSIEIRRRIGTIFQSRSLSTFDLLTAVGRDCVGAVQLLPPDTTASGWDRMEATPLSEDQVGTLLRQVTALMSQPTNDGLRVAIAGAQEKTALLRMGKHWYRP